MGISKMISKIKNAPYALMAAATVAIMFAEKDSYAQNAGQIAETVSGQLTSIRNLFVGGAFIVGVIFVATGLIKLKQAAETQGQQVKYGEGLWRLGLGAGLCAIPAIIGVGTETFGIEQDNTSGLGFN